MIKKIIKIKSRVWLYSGSSSWHFLSVPKKLAKEIQEKHGANARGWGSLPVLATIRKTKWRTSIFPDKQSGTYLLPLKKEIREKEEILSGDMIDFSIEIKV